MQAQSPPATVKQMHADGQLPPQNPGAAAAQMGGVTHPQPEPPGRNESGIHTWVGGQLPPHVVSAKLPQASAIVVVVPDGSGVNAAAIR